MWANKIGDLSQLINIIIRCRHRIRHAQTYIRCRLFPDRFFPTASLLVGVTVHLNTRIKTNKLKWKRSKNDATEAKPHAVKHQWVDKFLVCEPYHLVWVCFCWRTFGFDCCHFDCKVDGNTSHLSCTWFAAMFAECTQHTVHVIHIVLLIRIEYRAWIAVSTAAQHNMLHSQSSVLFRLFSVPFPLCFAVCSFCYLYLLFLFASEPVFLSHTEQWACQVLFCFKHNISTLRQKKRRLIWHTDRQIYISIIMIVACSLFLCANFMTFYVYVPFSLSLAFHRFRSFPFENEKNIRE